MGVLNITYPVQLDSRDFFIKNYDSIGEKMNQSQMETAQSQVKEVVEVMRNNIDNILERDNKLSALDERATNLEASSNMFQQSSRRLKKKYWWQNLKMKLWLGGCGIVILITIICIIYFSVPHGGGSSSGSDTTTQAP